MEDMLRRRLQLRITSYNIGSSIIIQYEPFDDLTIHRHHDVVLAPASVTG